MVWAASTRQTQCLDPRFMAEMRRQNGLAPTVRMREAGIWLPHLCDFIQFDWRVADWGVFPGSIPGAQLVGRVERT